VSFTVHCFLFDACRLSLLLLLLLVLVLVLLVLLLLLVSLFSFRLPPPNCLFACQPPFRAPPTLLFRLARLS
jgi:hypothetical protein